MSTLALLFTPAFLPLTALLIAHVIGTGVAIAMYLTPTEGKRA